MVLSEGELAACLGGKKKSHSSSCSSNDGSSSSSTSKTPTTTVQPQRRQQQQAQRLSPIPPRVTPSDFGLDVPGVKLEFSKVSGVDGVVAEARLCQRFMARGSSYVRVVSLQVPGTFVWPTGRETSVSHFSEFWDKIQNRFYTGYQPYGRCRTEGSEDLRTHDPQGATATGNAGTAPSVRAPSGAPRAARAARAPCDDSGDESHEHHRLYMTWLQGSLYQHNWSQQQQQKQQQSQAKKTRRDQRQQLQRRERERQSQQQQPPQQFQQQVQQQPPKQRSRKRKPKKKRQQPAKWRVKDEVVEVLVPQCTYTNLKTNTTITQT